MEPELAAQEDASRLARALWIEIDEDLQDIRSEVGRGSREPCGLKYAPGNQDGDRCLVEARESLVD